MPWLVFENDQMKCAVCIEQMSDNNKPISNANLKNQNTFITGCTNRLVSAVIDHTINKASQGNGILALNWFWQIRVITKFSNIK